jgi:hypothetical protein
MVRHTPGNEQIDGRIPLSGLLFHHFLGYYVQLSYIPLGLRVMGIFCLIHYCGLPGYDSE